MINLERYVTVCISGSDNGEVVKFLAIDGKYLDSTIALNGTVFYAVPESLVIAKWVRILSRLR